MTVDVRRPVEVEELLVPGRVGLRLRARLIVEVLRTYALARRLLREGNISEVTQTLRAAGDNSLDRESALIVGRRLQRPVVRTLSALPTDSRCLMRSLVLLGMMARRGAQCELSIGAQTDKGFAAHAWVEYDGVHLLPSLGYGCLTTI